MGAEKMVFKEETKLLFFFPFSNNGMKELLFFFSPIDL